MKIAPPGLILLRFSLMYLFAVQGIDLVLQFLNPIYPAYRDFSTNLLNPWATWCPHIDTGNEFTGCFGTNWARIGGPYSIMWYWSMIAIGANGMLPFSLGLFAINAALMLLVYRKKRWWALPYSAISTIFFLAFPQNLLSHFLTTLAILLPIGMARAVKWHGIFRISPVILSTLWKLPVGAGLTVWQFAFGHSIPDPVNWFPYALLAIWAVAASIQALRSRPSTKARPPSVIYRSYEVSDLQII